MPLEASSLTFFTPNSATMEVRHSANSTAGSALSTLLPLRPLSMLMFCLGMTAFRRSRRSALHGDLRPVSKSMVLVEHLIKVLTVVHLAHTSQASGC